MYAHTIIINTVLLCNINKLYSIIYNDYNKFSGANRHSARKVVFIFYVPFNVETYDNTLKK